MKFSKRIKAVRASQTALINKQATALIDEGKKVLDFSIGEPNFSTPKIVSDEAKKAIDQGRTQYTDVAGIRELREAVSERIKTDYRLEYSPEQITITCGAKQALYNTCLALLNEGDEVIIFSPYWVTYPEQVRLAGGKPVIVKTDINNGFQIQEDLLSAAITPKTKAIIINTPSNPTGIVLNQKSLSAVAQLAIENDCWIITDEIYSKILYDDLEYQPIISLDTELQKRVVLINGFSKSCAMTGWRIGYSASNPELAKILTKINSQTVTHPSSIAQYAATRACLNMDDFLPEMVSEFEKRRFLFLKELDKIDKLKVLKPNGAFYFFPDIRKIIENTSIKDDIQFCQELLKQQLVAVVPGSAFGTPGFVRISFSNSFENIKEFNQRLRKFVEKIA